MEAQRNLVERSETPRLVAGDREQALVGAELSGALDRLVSSQRLNALDAFGRRWLWNANCLEKSGRNAGARNAFVKRGPSAYVDRRQPLPGDSDQSTLPAQVCESTSDV